jgi:hypothetical protein
MQLIQQTNEGSSAMKGTTGVSMVEVFYNCVRRE